MINLNLLVIKTNQIEKVHHFYQQLGLQFTHHRHGNGPLHYATEMNGLVFEIYPLPKASVKPDKSTRLGFTVQKLDTLLSQLDANAITSPPQQQEWGYTAVVMDPDGRKIELVEAKKL